MAVSATSTLWAVWAVPTMPRKRVSKTVECAAHGMRCALAGGSAYRSEFCEPATPLLPQELELQQLLAEAGGVTEPTRDRRSLSQQDAGRRATLARAEADSAVREAQILAGGT